MATVGSKQRRRQLLRRFLAGQIQVRHLRELINPGLVASHHGPGLAGWISVTQITKVGQELMETGRQ